MSLQAPFDLRTAEREGVTVVAVAGELDCSTAPQLSVVLASLAGPDRTLLVDLRDTEFVDCAGMAPVVAASRRQHELGGQLIVECRKGAVSKLMESTGLDQFLSVAYAVEPSAAAVLSAQDPEGSRRTIRAALSTPL